jgi:hypothetical protein
MQERLLNEMLIDAIMRKMVSKTTRELFQIWQKEVVDEYRSEETLEAVRRILETRGQKPPSPAEVSIKDQVISACLGLLAIAAVLLYRNALTIEQEALLFFFVYDGIYSCIQMEERQS